MLVQAIFERWFVYYLTRKRRRLIGLVTCVVPYVICIACNLLSQRINSPFPTPRQKTV